MKAYLLDTSAFIKRYVKESGSEAVDSLFDEYATRYLSGLGLLETLSAFQRLCAVDRFVSEDQLRLLRAAVDSDVDAGKVVLLAATPADVDRAAGILGGGYLTAVDALHLAMALSLGPEATFVSADAKLNKAAESLGLAVSNPAAVPL